MRFYQFEFTLKDDTPDTPIHSEWFGSERVATMRRLELFKRGALRGKKSSHPIWPVDIPTDKQGMLAWLTSELTK